jgi:tight adherence protein B
MTADLGWVLAAGFASVALAVMAVAGAVGLRARRWRERFDADLGAGLRQSFVYLDPGRLFRLNLAVLALASIAAGAWTGQPIVAVAVLALFGAVPGLGLAWIRRRRLARLAAQWPDATMLVAGALRAGSSLPQAIGQAARELPAPSGRELDLVAREQRLGVGLDGALSSLERRVPLDGVVLFAAAARIAQESGGNLAETLERLADTLRRKAAVEGRIDALTAQGRLQGWVMAALPLAVGAALFAIEPVAMRPLVSTWQGGLVCMLVIALEAIGLHVVRRIVDIDV